MPADVGNQIVSLIYLMSATSGNVNRRHQGIRQLGIYSGGRLTPTVSPAATLSSLICEISDGTYQVKVQTTTAVSLTLAVATPYVVLRWTYAGASSDFMEVLTVATPSANDLVVGKAVFSGPTLTAFEYGGAIYPRSTPNTLDLFLKVEPTEDTEMKVRVRAGRVPTSTSLATISDQKSTSFVAPTANSRIDLLYVTSAGLIAIDSSGTEAASPSAPSYNGRAVLAEVTLASTSTNITADMIKDVRCFIASGDSGTKLPSYLATYNLGTQLIAKGSFNKADLGTIKNNSNLDITDNVITLLADRKYALTYAVSGQPTATSSQDPVLQAKWVCDSGDSSWDLETISLSSTECGEAIRQQSQISNTVYIIPDSDTEIELQIYTQNSIQKGQVDLVTVNIMALD